MSVLASCPECGAPLPPEGVDVEADTGRCGACGAGCRLSDIPKRLAMRAALAGPAPGGVWNLATPDGWAVGARFWDARAMVVITIFAAFWNGLIGYGMWDHISQLVSPHTNGIGIDTAMNILLIVFLIPFQLIGFALFGVAAFVWCGKEEVRAVGARGEVFAGVGTVEWTRVFNPAAVIDVRIAPSPRESNGKRVDQIEIEAERTIGVGPFLSEARRIWVAATLRERLVRGRG